MKVLERMSVLGYAVMVLGILGLIYTRVLFSHAVAVIAVQILAAGLMVWARATFGMRSFHYEASPTKGGLVTNGPYRYWRHPIYASILYFAAPGFLAHESVLGGLLFAILCIGAGLRIYCEEKLMVLTYPEYADYAKQTKRIIPYIF